MTRTREIVKKTRFAFETAKDRYRASKVAVKGTAFESQAVNWNSPMVGAWLCIIGLESYLDQFLENGVDGYTLLKLTHNEYVRCLGITNENHAHSLRMGLRLLHSTRIDYSHWEWSCEGTERWLKDRGLGVISEVFKQNAVHGGVLFSFTKFTLQQFLARLPAFDLNLFSPIIFKSLWCSIKRAKKTGTSQLFPEKFVEDWGDYEVEKWLGKINLRHLNPKFLEHGVNGTTLVRLTRKELFSIMGLSELQAKVVSRHIKLLHKVIADNGHNSIQLLNTNQEEKENDENFIDRKATSFNSTLSETSETSISTT